MKDEIFNRVRSFVIKAATVNENEVTEEASLENDLGIYGGDAVDFILAFGKEFNVNVSTFMAADYFSGEGDDTIESIIQLFSPKKKKQRKDLRVKHLMKAVLAGSLNDEVIDS